VTFPRRATVDVLVLKDLVGQQHMPVHFGVAKELTCKCRTKCNAGTLPSWEDYMEEDE